MRDESRANLRHDEIIVIFDASHDPLFQLLFAKRVLSLQFDSAASARPGFKGSDCSYLGPTHVNAENSSLRDEEIVHLPV